MQDHNYAVNANVFVKSYNRSITIPADLTYDADIICIDAIHQIIKLKHAILTKKYTEYFAKSYKITLNVNNKVASLTSPNMKIKSLDIMLCK